MKTQHDETIQVELVCEGSMFSLREISLLSKIIEVGLVWSLVDAHFFSKSYRKFYLKKNQKIFSELEKISSSYRALAYSESEFIAYKLEHPIETPQIPGLSKSGLIRGREESSFPLYSDDPLQELKKSKEAFVKRILPSPQIWYNKITHKGQHVSLLDFHDWIGNEFGGHILQVESAESGSWKLKVMGCLSSIIIAGNTVDYSTLFSNLENFVRTSINIKRAIEDEVDRNRPPLPTIEYPENGILDLYDKAVFECEDKTIKICLNKR